MTQRVGVYPGTFDPVTNGHMDIISRARHVVDKLIVAVHSNAGKGPMFSLDERTALLRDEVTNANNGLADWVEVRPFNKLLMKFVEEVNASCILRGLRAVSDFEYEFQMAGMNARLNPEIETVFLMASERQQFISSRFVKEIAKLGGDVSSFVSPRVLAKLGDKVGHPAP